MRLLKQSTAVDIVTHVFLDSTDFVSVKTGLSIAQADVQLSKNAGAFAQKNDATSATHLTGGQYKVPLNTTDTNTLGRIRLSIQKSGALPVWMDFTVVPANVYDSLIGGSDKLDVDTFQVTSGAITATAIASDAITSAKVADNAITAAKIASDAITSAKLADNAITANKIATDAITAAKIANNAITADKIATDAITAAKIAADAIGASELAADAVTEIQSGLATAASIAALHNLSAAQVNAEMLDVLTTDTFGEPSSVPAATSSLKDKINWLFMLARNKRQTSATSDAVRNDGDSASVASATLSDDGSTFTRGKYSS